MNTFSIGDHITLMLTLTFKGSPENISAYDTIECALTDLQRTSLSTDVVTATIVNAQDGVIKVDFTSSQTANLSAGNYLVEVQAKSATERVTYERAVIKVEAGLIP